MHLVHHFTLNNRICGLVAKKTQNATTFNFPTTIKLITESFSRTIIPKSASTSDIPNHFKSKLIKTVEGYLCYKMKKSQNNSSEVQVMNFSISQKIYVSFSRYSSFCILNHPIICDICDVMKSIRNTFSSSKKFH